MSSARRAWSAFASGGTPHDLVKACVGQLDGVVEEANLGLIFASGPVSQMVDEVIRILSGSLEIERWFGACSDGIVAGSIDIGTEGGLVVLCLALPPDGVEFVRASSLREWLPSVVPAADDANQTIWLCAAAEHDQAYEFGDVGRADVGGICSGPDEVPLIFNQPVAGGAIGLRCHESVRLFSGMSRGTRDLGPWRQITSSVGGCIMELDNCPAAKLVEADTGELLARQPDRLIRQVIVETTDADEPDMLMPRLALIERFERGSGRLQIRDQRPGNRMRLVYRQAAPAKTELAELARALLAAAKDEEVLAALLFSSEMRGEKLFGPANQEPEALCDELGGIPLIGLRTSDELYQGKLTCGAAVLVLVTAKRKTS